MIGNTIKLAAIYLLLGGIISCIDLIPEPCENNFRHIFEIDMTVSPDGNLYSVGDTITLYSTIGSTLIDQKNGQEIDCGDSFLFPLIMSMPRFDSLGINSTRNEFDYAESIGSLSVFENQYGRGAMTSCSLNNVNLNRELEVFIIPNEIGIYTIDLSYNGSNYSHGFLNNGDACKSESADLIFNTNNRENLGIELVELSGYFDENDPDRLTKEQFLEQGKYTFEVVE